MYLRYIRLLYLFFILGRCQNHLTCYWYCFRLLWTNYQKSVEITQKLCGFYLRIHVVWNFKNTMLERVSFSPCGNYLAHFTPSGVLRIWESETNYLKLEFTPNSHLSSPCSSLTWIPVTNSSGKVRWYKLNVIFIPRY